MAKDNRSKQAYIKSTEIQAKLNEGILDQYDIVYCSDTHQACYIDGKKIPHFVNYRFDIYQDIASAELAINNLDYTHEGQIVMIYTLEDGIKPYVVNVNGSGSYYVTATTSGHIDAIVDYDKADNIPIVNITANEEIILSELPNGYYKIVGNYIFSPLDTTHRMLVSKTLFVIEHVIENSVNITYITQIKASKIDRYKVIEGEAEIVEDRYVLYSELTQKIDEEMDDKVDTYIDNYVEDHETTEEDISNLFN